MYVLPASEYLEIGGLGIIGQAFSLTWNARNALSNLMVRERTPYFNGPGRHIRLGLPVTESTHAESERRLIMKSTRVRRKGTPKLGISKKYLGFSSLADALRVLRSRGIPPRPQQTERLSQGLACGISANFAARARCDIQSTFAFAS